MQGSALRCVEMNATSHLMRVPHRAQFICLSGYSMHDFARKRASSATKLSTLMRCGVCMTHSTLLVRILLSTPRREMFGKGRWQDNQPNALQKQVNLETAMALFRIAHFRKNSSNAP